MSIKKILLFILVSIFATFSLYSQSQDPPTKEDLERKIIKRIYNDVSDKNRWEIKVEYPELRLEGDKDAVGFNKAAKDMAMKQVEDFKKTMSEFTDEDRSFLPKDMNYYMEVGYSIDFENDEFVSVAFGRSDFTGGAHPNHWSFSLNYDLANEKTINLTDLFKPSSKFLTVISKNSIEQLKKEQGEYADDEWITNGAGEDLKNFESWNISQAGLKFSFDPYQVGPYAAGAFETVVPFNKFTMDMQTTLFNRVQNVSYIAGNPANWCRNGLFPNQDVEFRVARVKGVKNEKTYFYSDDEDCPNGENCRQKTYIIAGDEVIVSRTYGDYSCVWYQPTKGSETVGWILTDKITEKAPLKPGNISWIGEWRFYDNSINFVSSKTKGKYMVSGSAFWKGVGDNIHIGELGFDAIPEKNKIKGGDGENQYDCQVKMQRVGRFLIVSDNKQCGGMNVTFDGVYTQK